MNKTMRTVVLGTLLVALCITGALLWQGHNQALQAHAEADKANRLLDQWDALYKQLMLAAQADVPARVAELALFDHALLQSEFSSKCIKAALPSFVGGEQKILSAARRHVESDDRSYNSELIDGKKTVDLFRYRLSRCERSAN